MKNKPVEDKPVEEPFDDMYTQAQTALMELCAMSDGKIERDYRSMQSAARRLDAAVLEIKTDVIRKANPGK